MLWYRRMTLLASIWQNFYCYVKKCSLFFYFLLLFENLRTWTNKKVYKPQWCWISILAAQNTNWKQIKGVKKYVLNNAGDIDDCCYAARAILILFLLHRQFLYNRLLSMYMFPFLSYHILSNYPNVHFKSSRKTCFFCHYTVQSI